MEDVGDTILRMNNGEFSREILQGKLNISFSQNCATALCNRTHLLYMKHISDTQRNGLMF